VGALLGRGLASLPSLTDLNLSHNAIADSNAAALCEALFCTNTQSDDDAAAALPPRCPLLCLNLGTTGAGDEAAAACAAALQLPRVSLHALCLSGHVGDKGAATLFRALPHAPCLTELWLGDYVGDEAMQALMEVLLHPPSCAAVKLMTLGLGGEVRGGTVLKSSFGQPGVTALCDLPRTAASLTDLRFSGNLSMGGEGAIALLTSLQACHPRSCQVRTLHIDSCGLAKEDLPAFLEALDQVWVLHELRADGELTPPTPSPHGSRPPTSGSGSKPALFGSRFGSKPGSGSKPATPTAGASPSATPTGRRVGSLFGTGAGKGPSRLLSLQQKMGISKLLEDNKKMGPRRVESWRLSRSLEEVAWVFSKLCVNVPPTLVDSGLPSWTGEECAHFVANLGLPQYSNSFAFNLRGSMLPSLKMTQLAQLGVGVFAHQKLIMENVRHLINAFERKDRAARAQAAWAGLLVPGSTPVSTPDVPDPASQQTDAADVLPLPRRSTHQGAVGRGSAGRLHVPRNSPLKRPNRDPTGVTLSQYHGSRESPGALPVDLRLPRIASIRNVDARLAPAEHGLPKPSVLMPPPPNMLGASPRADEDEAAGGLAGTRIEQTQWKSLARSYGLHLIPETRAMLHDNLQAVINAPKPPEVPEVPALAGSYQAEVGARASQKRVTQLSSSPSLPMLSPGQLGARNWVTFLHG